MRFKIITPGRRRQLASGESLSEYGISVRKLANGDEKWSLAFMYLGTRIKRVLGLKSEGWNATKALERRDEIRAELREGTNPLPRGRRTPLRFAELAAWYREEMVASGGKNLDRKQLQLERRLVPRLGHLVVDAITEEQLRRYGKELIDEGLSPSTVNRDLATVSHMWSTGVRARKLRRKPCAVPKSKEPQGRTVVLTDEQSSALLEAASRDHHRQLWLFVLIGLQTGMRSAEILSSRFDHIDWEHCRLHVPRAKAGARSQPLTKSLVAVLRAEHDARRGRDIWIFPSSRTSTGHVNELNGPFRRAVIAAGLSPDLVTPHVMRHTAATKMVASGAPLPAIQSVTGHKTLAMLMRYTHLADKNVDMAVSALDRPHPVRGDD